MNDPLHDATESSAPITLDEIAASAASSDLVEDVRVFAGGETGHWVVLVRPRGFRRALDIRDALAGTSVLANIDLEIVVPPPDRSWDDITDVSALDVIQGVADFSRYAEAQTEYERVLLGIWQEVLPDRRIGIDDHFFDLGGDSLLAVEVVARLEELQGVQIPLETLMDAPTIRILAAAADSGFSAADSA